MENIKAIISEKLKAYMFENNMNQRQLADYIRRHDIPVSNSAVNFWVNGQKAPTNADFFEKLCDLFDISISGYGVVVPVTQRKFPLLGAVACGEPIWADEDRDCYVMADSTIKADFCLICRGDSMEPLVHNGDIVFVRKQDSVNNGEVAVVIIDNEATLKRVYQTNDDITLVAENKAYVPIVVRASENKSVRVCGKAIFYQSLIK